MQVPIYLDYNSTTPIDRRVLDEMLPFLTNEFGNASSKLHSFGWNATSAIELARKKTAEFLACEPSEIIFTSGATESINTILKGVFEMFYPLKNEIITARTEHKAVLDVCEYLEKKGALVHYLDVLPDGNIDLQQLRELINEKTIVVALMGVNNETGLVHPLEEIGKITKERNTYFFSDLTQAAGKLYLNVNQMNIDIACLSAHKMYGPKGVGCIFKRRKHPQVRFTPLLHGGSHEEGNRSGTLNVAGIVGLGKACELSQNEYWDDNTRISALRAKLEHQLLDFEGVRINGDTKNRVYNTSNICFSGRSAAELVKKINNRIAVSFGSACISNKNELSHVLKAMKLEDKEIQSSIRFSLGKMSKESEIETTIKILTEVLTN